MGVVQQAAQVFLLARWYVMADVLQWLWAAAAQVILYVLVPLPALWRMHRPARGVIDLMIMASVAGVCSQAVLGLLWDHLVAAHPEGEAAVFLLFWSMAWFLLRFRREPRAAPATDALPVPRGLSWVIAGVVVAGFVLRSLHPLQCAALGQSDAYSHLDFIRDILRDGCIRMRLYPPGYHWVLALPALALFVDPYLLARYGGAFFGVMLILGCLALGHTSGRASVAVCCAYLVSCFPGSYLLLKTGVGAFPNQIGLALMPFIFAQYLGLVGRGPRWPVWLLALTLFGIVSAVPLMLADVVLVIGAERLLALAGGERAWPRLRWRAVCEALALFAAFIAFHFFRSGVGALANTGRVMAGSAREASWPPSPGQALVNTFTDFLVVKRVGFGTLLLDAAWIGIGLAFVGVLGLGLRRRDPAMRLLGVWGLLTALQTGTGCLQFTWYQRAGWQLLEALAWLGGLVLAWTWDAAAGIRLVRRLLIFALAVTAAAAFIWHPTHRFCMSTAENEIACLARSLARLGWEPGAGAERTVRTAGREWPFLQDFNPRMPMVVVTRRYQYGNRGDMVHALMGHDAGIRVVSYGGSPVTLPLKPGRQLLVLLDRDLWMARPDLGPTALLSPSLADGFLADARDLHGPNKAILTAVRHVPLDAWRVREYLVSANLTVFTITPFSGSAPGLPAPQQERKP